MQECNRYIDVLIDSLENQIEILKEILNVSYEQGKLADELDLDIDVFEVTLDKKENLIIQLNKFDVGFASIYGRVRKKIEKDNLKYQNQIKRLQRLIKESTDLSVEIKMIENLNKQKLVFSFSNLHKECNKKKNAALVVSQYNKSMQYGKLK